MDTPTNVVPTVSAGGDLDPNTTYYIRIVAVTPIYGAGHTGLYAYDPRESSPSTEILTLITTTKLMTAICNGLAEIVLVLYLASLRRSPYVGRMAMGDAA